MMVSAKASRIAIAAASVHALHLQAWLQFYSKRMDQDHRVPLQAHAPDRSAVLHLRQQEMVGHEPVHRRDACATPRLTDVAAMALRLTHLRAGALAVSGSMPAPGTATNAAFWRSSAFAAPWRQLSAMDCDTGSGKMSSSPRSTPSKISLAADSGELFGMSKPRFISVSTGPVRTAWTLTPRPATSARSDCVMENAAAFEIE